MILERPTPDAPPVERSSTLPRGYRGDILKELKSAMTKLKLKKPVQEKILGGNLEKLLERAKPEA